MNSVTDDLLDRCHAIRYRIELSILYHQKRERFFDVLDKVAKATAVIGGSAALAKVADGDWLMVIAAFITVSSTLSLVFGFSERSRRHSELARSLRELDAIACETDQQKLDDQQVGILESKARRLEISEPAALSALVVLCQNELAIAQNQPDKIIHQPLWVRWMAHFFDLPRHSSH